MRNNRRAEWKPVVGWEDLYMVSSYGEIYSLKSKKNRALNNSGKYSRISLFRGKQSYRTLVHILVAKAFLENPQNKPCVNHIDGNKKNNNVDNLEWCTYKENTQHAKKILGHSFLDFDKRGENNGRAKLNSSIVKKIRKENTMERGYATRIARELGVGSTAIYDILNFKSWTHI